VTSGMVPRHTYTERSQATRKRQRRGELCARVNADVAERQFLVARGYLDPLGMSLVGDELDRAVQQFFSDRIAEAITRGHL
jgi:hypothetical protein